MRHAPILGAVPDAVDRRPERITRLVRPGAVRIGTRSPDSALEVTAFRNRDGSTVVVALNTATTQPPVPLRHGQFDVTVPARSLVTYVIRDRPRG
jgi:O-glycosyl hydrolase